MDRRTAVAEKNLRLMWAIIGETVVLWCEGGNDHRIGMLWQDFLENRRRPISPSILVESDYEELDESRGMQKGNPGIRAD